jgi:prohibitin 1
MIKNTEGGTPSVLSKGSSALGTLLGSTKQYTLAIVLIVLVSIVGCGSFFSVGAGVVGVTFNSITGDTAAYSQGMYFKIPIVTSVIKFDVKTQREDIQADSASKDLQKVKVHVAINYHLDYKKVNELYVKVGRDYIEKVINPAVNESVKASVAQFPVEEIIVKREDVKILIEKSLKDRLAIYNIILESVNLVNISFDEEFNRVVEQKQIEEQKIKTAEYIKKQAEQKKQATILEAEGEARKQELLRATISKDTVMMKWIDKWDGKLPTYMMGDKTMMMVPGDNK